MGTNIPVTTGDITGRNGTYDIQAIHIGSYTMLSGEEWGFIDGISKKQGNPINGGIHGLQMKEFEAGIITWLCGRGYRVEDNEDTHPYGDITLS